MFMDLTMSWGFLSSFSILYAVNSYFSSDVFFRLLPAASQKDAFILIGSDTDIDSTRAFVN